MEASYKVWTICRLSRSFKQVASEQVRFASREICQEDLGYVFLPESHQNVLKFEKEEKKCEIGFSNLTRICWDNRATCARVCVCAKQVASDFAASFGRLLCADAE